MTHLERPGTLPSGSDPLFSLHQNRFRLLKPFYSVLLVSFLFQMTNTSLPAVPSWAEV